MKPQAIIVDIDGTLADARHREHHLEIKAGERVDWEAWDRELPKDTPFLWCVELITAMKNHGVEIIFLTGRGERTRFDTGVWLLHHVGDWAALKTLLMRGTGDYRKDTVIKTEFYEKVIKPQYDVLFALDDRDSVAEMWRSLGVVCLHCDRWGDAKEAGMNNILGPSKSGATG